MWGPLWRVAGVHMHAPTAGLWAGAYRLVLGLCGGFQPTMPFLAAPSPPHTTFPCPPHAHRPLPLPPITHAHAQRGNHFAETSIRARQAIAELGSRFIRNNGVVLTHGHSRVVLALLQRAVTQVRGAWGRSQGMQGGRLTGA